MAIALGDFCGVSGDVSLEVELKISADGFPPGSRQLILPACHAQGTAASVVLGQAETIIVQLGGHPDPYRHEWASYPNGSTGWRSQRARTLRCSARTRT
jgi:hypothetical protein